MVVRRLLLFLSLGVLCLPIAPAQDREAWVTGPYQTTSRLGRKLFAMADTDGVIRKAQVAAHANPREARLAVALSKAQAAARQYKEAVATCTKALAVSPQAAELYLERGHRRLGLRDFSAAQADLEKAVALDSTMLDAHYHLGMAYYFQSNFGKAAVAFRHALDLAKSVDSVIDCSNWLYVSLRRAGQKPAATEVLQRITPEMKNTEPHLYFYLRLLRFYQGKLSEAEVLPAPPTGPTDVEGELSFNTINYGVGNWHVYNGEPAAGKPYFEKVVKGFAWNSWGFIGSELALSSGPTKP